MKGGLRLSTILAILLLSATAHAETLRLRVLTYNIWGIPVVSAEREERVQKIGPAIAKLEPDLVVLQEVWVDEDAQVISSYLANAGLPHSQRFVSYWPGHSGLLIVSAYPIKEVTFSAYTQGRYPNKPWDLDWVAGKGMGRVRVETPLGELDVAGTHLQATYGTNDYFFVQLHQMLEASDVIRFNEAPLIVAGDLNTTWDTVPMQIFAARAGLIPTDPRAGIDTVLYRNGRSIQLETIDVRDVLDQPIDLGGSKSLLSDHKGRLADLQLSKCSADCQSPSDAPRLSQALTKLLPKIKEELLMREQNIVMDQSLALVFFNFAMLFWTIRRRWQSLSRGPWLAGLSFIFILASAWFFYLSLGYGPDQLEGLRSIQSRLLGQ